jgi:hypothetical protein
VRRDERWTVAAVAAVALAARLYLLDGPASADLDLGYAVARHWGTDPSNVVPPYRLLSALWWPRPLAFVLAAPFAAAGPFPFRVGVALAATAPFPLAAWAALRANARPWVAGLAVGVAAALPSVARAGTDAWPASLAVAFALGAFHAMRSERPIPAAALALASAWSHPIGLLAPLALLAVTAARAAQRGEARLYPLELDGPATAAAAALLLAPLPSAVAWLRFGGPTLLATASWAAAGAVALVVLVPPLLVAALRPHPVAAAAPALAVVAVLAASLALPGLGPSPDPGIDGAVAALGPSPWGSVLLVDVDWRLVPHPFADGARLVGWAYTTVSLPPGDWVHAVEGSNWTVLAKEDRPLSHALRSAYGGCAVYEDARYVVLDGACTPGHGAAFRAQISPMGPPN